MVPGDVAWGEAEEDGEQDDVGEVDDDEGEKDAIFFEVRLVARDHPECPHEVKCPGGADEEIEGFVVVRDIGSHFQ